MPGPGRRGPGVVSPAEACVFCEIVAGASPAAFVLRDERVSAFLDVRPIVPGHTLVVPNAHGASLEDVGADVAADVMRCAHVVAAAVRRSGLRCEGVNLLLADGPAAGQEVFHVHLHVIPRHAGDGFRLHLRQDEEAGPTRSELDDVAAVIGAAL
jgi:histidine triad (HIT) family protein